MTRNFKDPASVKFKDVTYGCSEETGRVAWVYVNAKNSFGAYTGKKKFISSGETTLYEEISPNFSELWLGLMSGERA